MDALGTQPEKDGFDRVEVAVAAGHVRDRLNPEAAPDAPREHRCIHARARDGIVSNRDGMNARRLKFPCTCHEFIRIAGIRRIEFDRDGNFPCLQRLKERAARGREFRAFLPHTFPLRRSPAFKCLTQRSDVLRCRAAAAAGNRDTLAHDSGKAFPKVVRRTLIEGAPIDDDRMPCVRHKRKRQGACADEVHEFLH